MAVAQQLWIRVDEETGLARLPAEQQRWIETLRQRIGAREYGLSVARRRLEQLR